MTNQINIPFALGVTVWWSGFGSRTEWVECPECAGTCVIEMTKGNGERVSLACNLCGPSYEPPKGVIQRHIYEHSPVPFIPARVRMDGDEFWYSESDPTASSYSSVQSTSLFISKEECEARCKQLNEDRAKHDAEMLLHSISSKRRSLSHSSHYWSREVKRLEQQLEAARARLSRCKIKKSAEAQ